jgi:hypothetical protein
MSKPAPTEFACAAPSEADVLQLIADYRRAARVAVAALCRQLGTTDLLSAWRQGHAPRSGRLKQPPGQYEFHGAGCRFEISGRTVDVDFGTDGRYDGFDGWRLAAYARSAFEWADLASTRIDDLLRALEARGVIYKPGRGPAADLFYTRDDDHRPVGAAAAAPTAAATKAG